MNKLPPDITSNYADMSTLQIPQYWTPEQALAVWEFLDEIARGIWQR